MSRPRLAATCLLPTLVLVLALGCDSRDADCFIIVSAEDEQSCLFDLTVVVRDLEPHVGLRLIVEVYRDNLEGRATRTVRGPLESVGLSDVLRWSRDVDVYVIVDVDGSGFCGVGDIVWSETVENTEGARTVHFDADSPSSSCP
ncbi:MAG: hypothetical protein O7B99_12720 [Planctomycetota bacterium]|nr:hypothetical protein [Planctomycetota bacterium]